MYNGSAEKPYVNPKAPVHIVTGSAGNRERIDNFIPNPPIWSAFRHSDYGYTHMQIFNSTHLHLQQVSDDQVIQIYFGRECVETDTVDGVSYLASYMELANIRSNRKFVPFFRLKHLFRKPTKKNLNHRNNFHY